MCKFKKTNWFICLIKDNIWVKHQATLRWAKQQFSKWAKQQFCKLHKVNQKQMRVHVYRHTLVLLLCLTLRSVLASSLVLCSPKSHHRCLWFVRIHKIKWLKKWTRSGGGGYRFLSGKKIFCVRDFILMIKSTCMLHPIKYNNCCVYARGWVGGGALCEASFSIHINCKLSILVIHVYQFK